MIHAGGGDDRIMRPSEIQEFLSISERSVARLLASGALPKIRLGVRAVGVHRRDVLRLLHPNDGYVGRANGPRSNNEVIT
jgi:predicted DNA-binding transcriptional regulator AlpA